MMGLMEAPSGYGMSVYGEFESFRDAMVAITAYYERFPAMGYGTSLTAVAESGKVEVRGKRALSCD